MLVFLLCIALALVRPCGSTQRQCFLSVEPRHAMGKAYGGGGCPGWYTFGARLTHKSIRIPYLI